MIKGIEVTDTDIGLWKQLCFQKIGALVFKLSDDFKHVG